MKNLLGFEFHKLFRAKSFYICTAVIFLMSFLTILVNKLFLSSTEMASLMPDAMQTMLSAVSSSNFTMIAGIFIAIFACYDYEQQTIKNIYSHGFSRNKVYFAKLIICSIATIIMFALTLLFNYLLGLTMLNGATKDGNYLGLVLGQLIYVVAYCSFVFAINLIVKKVGISIAFAILGPSLITLLITLIDSLLKIKDFKISSYWFGKFIEDLTNLATTANRLWTVMGLSLIYALIFILGGYLINKKQEN